MKWVLVLITMISFSWIDGVTAQLDPSSTLLLDSGRDNPDNTGLDTGRYKVRKRKEEFKDPLSIQTEKKSPKEENVKKIDPPVTEKIEVPRVEEKTEPKTVDTVIESEADAEVGKLEIMRIGISPFFFYKDSSSLSLYRSYNLSSPGVRGFVDIWLTPQFGVYTDISMSLGASVSGALNSSRQSYLEHQWFDTGFMYRQNFSLGRRVEFRLSYLEAEEKVSSADTFRAGLRTSGVKLGARFFLQKEKGSQWFVETWLSPSQSHKEKETGINIKSGDKGETNTLGLSIGKLYELDSSNEFYWGVRSVFEKNRFKGDSSPADPLRSSTFENLEVNQSSIFVEFGYNWSR